MSSPNLICPAVPELPAGAPPSVLPPSSTHKFRRGWWIGLIFFLLLMLFAPLIYGGTEAAVAGVRARTALRLAYAELTAAHFESARGYLSEARQQLMDTRRGLKHTFFWRSVPFVGTYLQGMDQALQASTIALEGATALADAAVRIHDAFQTISAIHAWPTSVDPRRSFADLSREERRTILASVQQALPEIRLAREKTLLALDAWGRIPTQDMIAPVQRVLLPITQALEQFRARSTELVSLAEVVVPMLGYPYPKTFVVLLQNADELRPTGGFIGTVGIVQIDAGSLTRVDFKDVYAYDRVAATSTLGPPPEPLRRELGVQAWYLRDSNWSPDFPQAATRIASLFDQSGWIATSGTVGSMRVDGVIALEPGLFRQLLEFVGPLTVNGVTYTPEHFFDQLQYAVEVGFQKQGIPNEERKDVIADLGAALVQRLVEQPARRWPAFLELGFSALQQKEALFFLTDPGMQSIFDARRWSGRMRGTSQDSLAVVDANLAALKTDGVMEKKISYQVDLTDPAGPLATVRLTYHNTAQAVSWRYTRYRDYVRVYVPEGSALVSSVASGIVDVMHDLGKTVFGAFWVIEPGDTRTLEFTYRLPRSILLDASGRPMYHLLVQKQPGSHQRLTLQLNFGKTLVSASPPEDPREFGDTSYRISSLLNEDQEFTVQSE